MCVWDFSSYVVSRPVYVFLISTISLPIPFTLMYRFIYALFAWKTRKFPHTRVAWSACSAFAFWRSDVLWARWMLWFLYIALTTEWDFVTDCHLYTVPATVFVSAQAAWVTERLTNRLCQVVHFSRKCCMASCQAFFLTHILFGNFLYAHWITRLIGRSEIFRPFLHVLTYHCVICFLSAFYEPT